VLWAGVMGVPLEHASTTLSGYAYGYEPPALTVVDMFNASNQLREEREAEYRRAVEFIRISTQMREEDEAELRRAQSPSALDSEHPISAGALLDRFHAMLERFHAVPAAVPAVHSGTDVDGQYGYCSRPNSDDEGERPKASRGSGQSEYSATHGNNSSKSSGVFASNDGALVVDNSGSDLNSDDSYQHDIPDTDTAVVFDRESADRSPDHTRHRPKRSKKATKHGQPNRGARATHRTRPSGQHSTSEATDAERTVRAERSRDLAELSDASGHGVVSEAPDVESPAAAPPHGTPTVRAVKRLSNPPPHLCRDPPTPEPAYAEHSTARADERIAPTSPAAPPASRKAHTGRQGDRALAYEYLRGIWPYDPSLDAFRIVYDRTTQCRAGWASEQARESRRRKRTFSTLKSQRYAKHFSFVDYFWVLLWGLA
jgi:hypothetical protein